MFLKILTALSLTLSYGYGKVAQKRPNIVFFLIDDLHYQTLGYAGDKVVKTPHIDNLAAQGVQFENCFASTSICAASRASILTGRYERGHQFTFKTKPLSQKWLSESYPMKLRENGYRTGFIGKYGVVNAKAISPKKMFDVYKPINRTPYRKKQADGSLIHTTDLCAAEAVKFISKSDKTKPFCLSVSFSAVHAEDNDKEDHYPWPEATNELYKDIIFAPPRLDDPEIFNKHPDFFKKSENRNRFHWRWDTPEKYQKNMLGYYRMVTGVDSAIGRVLDTLEQQSLTDNTIIIVMGDNGYYKGNRGFAGKWSHYEESLRIPLVILDPRSQHPKGRISSDITLNLDIPSTILDYATLKSPTTYQGSSLKPLVNDKQAAGWRSDFLCEHLMEHKSIPKWEGVRNERYIYARYTQQEPMYEYLHDLETDPDQLNNLTNSEKHLDILNELRTRCNTLIKKHQPMN